MDCESGILIGVVDDGVSMGMGVGRGSGKVVEAEIEATKPLEVGIEGEHVAMTMLLTFSVEVGSLVLDEGERVKSGSIGSSVAVMVPTVSGIAFTTPAQML